MFVRETMTLQKWYGKSLSIPDFDNHDYIPFVASGLGIVRSILQKEIGSRIAIRFRKVNTAHADFEKQEIAINDQYLYGHISPEYPELNSDDAISLIMGIVVHEAAHFAYSPSDLKPWAEYIRKGTSCTYIENVALTLGNVIEDVFIEAEIDRRVPTLSWFLDCVNHVFFSSKSFGEVLDKVRTVTTAPTKDEDLGSVLSLLIYAKTRTEVVCNPYADELFYLVRSATVTGVVQDRFALALKVYDKLMANYLAEESKEEGEGEGSGAFGLGESESEGGSKSDEGEGGSKSEGGSESEGEEKLDPIAAAKKMAEGLTAIAAGHGKMPATDYTDIDLEDKIDSIAEMEVSIEEGRADEPFLVYMEKTPSLGHLIEADSRYDRLAEIGRQRAVANRPYGLDRTRGNTIRKLYRIATDQKIFAESVAMSSYKPMQVVILVDCSGSMSCYGGGSDTPIHEAARAALGAARGLADAHCEVAVYGHTACVKMDSDVVIYKAKTFNEPVSVLPGRLGSLVYEESLRENKDGYAIRYIAKKFTSSTKRRLLIVISDGAPAAPGYHGLEANMHTKRSVDEVRARGIDVLSISINESARRVNDSIYGKDNNVFNTDLNVIEEIVRSLLLKGATA